MKHFNHKKSILKEKLVNREFTLGSWLTIPNRAIVEVMGLTKIDWIVIDIEHSPISIDQVCELIAHTQANGMQSLVRVGSNDELIIKRVLDSGADGIIVPMVKDKHDVERLINFSKYPPVGNRGVGLNRAQKYGAGFDSYTSWVENKIVLIAQIEHIEAVNNLEEILSYDEIDGIIIGPYDLSASMGFPGKYNKKEVKDVLEKAISIAKNKKKSIGSHVIESSHLNIIDKINSGYNFIVYSVDFILLHDKIREELDKINF